MDIFKGPFSLQEITLCEQSGKLFAACWDSDYKKKVYLFTDIRIDGSYSIMDVDIGDNP